MTIRQITPYQILDSRGEPTLMVRMVSDTGNVAEFATPAGASQGKTEAKEKRDGEADVYNGLGVKGCIQAINEVITPKFLGYPLDQLDDFDELLIALDGSEHKDNLGANTLLALSGAYLKLSAQEKNKPLWQYIAEYNQTSPEFPQLFTTIIGGGKHAPGLDIQEYMVVPQSTTPSQAVQTVYDVYHAVRNIMENLYGPSATLVSDEGGLAPIGTSTEVILEALSGLNGKMSSKFAIALDSAANSFYKDGLYQIESQNLHASDLFKLYQQWDSKFDLYSIEDPFAEEDLEGTEIIKNMAGKPKPFLVFADDYTVTNKAKIEEVQQANMFDGIVIKPNQIGTFTETFAAIAAARASKAKVLISHRSGETTDSLIADLAYGVGAMGLKLGAPVRGERVAKYNRLLEIEADLQQNQQPAPTSSVIPPTPSTPSMPPIEPSSTITNPLPPVPAMRPEPATAPAPMATQPQPQPVASLYQPPISPLTSNTPLPTNAANNPTPTSTT